MPRITPPAAYAFAYTRIYKPGMLRNSYPEHRHDNQPQRGETRKIRYHMAQQPSNTFRAQQTLYTYLLACLRQTHTQTVDIEYPRQKDNSQRQQEEHRCGMGHAPFIPHNYSVSGIIPRPLPDCQYQEYAARAHAPPGA